MWIGAGLSRIYFFSLLFFDLRMRPSLTALKIKDNMLSEGLSEPKWLVMHNFW